MHSPQWSQTRPCTYLTRFIHIINDLKSLGKDYTYNELVNKYYQLANRKAKDPRMLPFQQLHGLPITHEIILRENERKEKKEISQKPLHQGMK